MKNVGEGVLTFAEVEDLWGKLTTNFYPKGIATIWAVFAKEDSRYIGHASLRPRPEIKEDWEIGYILKQNKLGERICH